MANSAIFIDRDGTISEEVGYVNHVSRYRVFPFSAEAIKLINDSPLKAVLVTNQAGVARGYFKEEIIGQVHSKLAEELGNHGAKLDAIYYCPHHPSVGEPPYRQDCNCRKPKPGLLENAAKDLSIDLHKSYMIGDRYSDVKLAHSVGARGVLVLTGYGRGEFEYQREEWAREPDHIAEDLLAAVKWILASETIRPDAKK
jgi:D-glycero-D-manno-heptose 1,7-bisphosphate phosphatase